jgi:hypothetical protein
MIARQFARWPSPVLLDASDSLPATGPRRRIALCTGLWTSCADTPTRLCAPWGYSCGNGPPIGYVKHSACIYAMHCLCVRKTPPPKDGPQRREVIHIRNLTSNVTCKRRQQGRERVPVARPGASPAGKTAAQQILAGPRAVIRCPSADACPRRHRQPQPFGLIGRQPVTSRPTVRPCVRQ